MRDLVRESSRNFLEEFEDPSDPHQRPLQATSRNGELLLINYSKQKLQTLFVSVCVCVLSTGSRHTLDKSHMLNRPRQASTYSGQVSRQALDRLSTGSTGLNILWTSLACSTGLNRPQHTLDKSHMIWTSLTQTVWYTPKVELWWN